MKVGDIVYAHDERYDDKISKGKITKIGRKYVYAKFGYYESKYEIENNFREVKDYGRKNKLYFSIDEIKNESYKNYLIPLIYRKIAYSNLQNIQIENIVTISKLLNIENNFEEKWKTIHMSDFTTEESEESNEE